MKPITILLCSFFISSVVLAQRSEIRDVQTFNEIAFATSGTVYLKQGNTQKVELKGDRADLDEIRTEVRGGRLLIKNRSNSWFTWNNNSNVDIYITMKKLNGVSVSGSGRVYGESKFITDFLELGVSGAGKMELDADAKEVDMSISGSGKIVLGGEGKITDISISGSGKIDAEDFKASNHEIRISGSGSCYVHADESIEARISGSGSVYYKGDARKINSRSSGSGKVKRI
ncbi:MAG: head GIN domain-containing protein [Bacteroidota bacterium]